MKLVVKNKKELTTRNTIIGQMFCLGNHMISFLILSLRKQKAYSFCNV